MGVRKDYILQSWPQNDTVYNTKKYKVTKKSPVPIHTKIFAITTLIALITYFTYLAIARSYVEDAPVLSVLQRQCSSVPQICFNVAVLGLVNHILCYVFQSDFEESIIILKNIGVELSSTVPSKVFFMKNSTKEQFIPINDVIDIVIHEAFKGFEVVFYMILLRQSAKKLTIVFENLLPRRYQLEVVLRGSRKVLFHGREDNKLNVPGRQQRQKEQEAWS